MRFLLLSLMFVTPLSAQSADPAIRGVITDQLDAFSAGDFPRAFSFASDTLQRVFVTPEGFRQMVETGYQMVIDPRDVSFGGTEPDGPYTWQRVYITDRAGLPYTLRYQMEPTPEGPRINAVEIVPGHELSA